MSNIAFYTRLGVKLYCVLAPVAVVVWTFIRFLARPYPYFNRVDEWHNDGGDVNMVYFGRDAQGHDVYRLPERSYIRNPDGSRTVVDPVRRDAERGIRYARQMREFETETRRVGEHEHTIGRWVNWWEYVDDEK